MKRNFRSTILSATLYITLGIIGLLIKDDLRQYFHINPLYLILIPAILLIIGIGTMVFIYLQGGFKTEDERSPQRDHYYIKLIENLKKDLTLKINSIENISIDEDRARQIIDSKLNNITNEVLFEQIKTKYEDRLIEDIRFRTLEEELGNLKNRIGMETDRASRNSNINLSIGVSTTLLAIFFLAYSLLYSSATPPSTKNSNIQSQKQEISLNKKQPVESKVDKKPDIYISTASFIYHFIPRLSLSILIELFSFFFLRIYRRNLDDIKYLNNESTNVDLKLIALRTSILYEDTDSLKGVIDELSKTERNFILKLGESTVEIEKVKVDNSNSEKFLDNLVKLVQRK